MSNHSDANLGRYAISHLENASIEAVLEEMKQFEILHENLSLKQLLERIAQREHEVSCTFTATTGAHRQFYLSRKFAFYKKRVELNYTKS